MGAAAVDEVVAAFRADAVLDLTHDAELDEGAGRIVVTFDLGTEHALDRLFGVLDRLQGRENLVVVTGVADAELDELDPADPSLHWHGRLVSASPALVGLHDFLSRNRIAFTTASGAVVFSVESGIVQPTHASSLPEVFARFQPWEGTVEPGWLVNWIGARNRTSMQTDARSYLEPTIQRGEVPSLSEELFEWIDVLESVVEAGEVFTMVELGAGYGRWTVSAVAALRQLDPQRPFRLVAVEAEPTHYKWLRRTLADNGIDPHRHRLIKAAVAAQDGAVRFQRGDAADWYGQAIERPDPSAKLAGALSRLIRWSRNSAANRLAFGHSARKVRRTAAVSLATVLSELDQVDLIHVDVQGAEADVLEAGAKVLAEKVRRVHVGTHDTENEERLRRLFVDLGWENRFDYPGRSQSVTPWGPVAFQDGVQSWVNPARQRAATS